MSADTKDYLMDFDFKKALEKEVKKDISFICGFVSKDIKQTQEKE